MNNTNHPNHPEHRDTTVVSLFSSRGIDTLGIMTTAMSIGKEWINNLPANEIRKIFSYLENDANPTDTKLRIIENLIPHFALDSDLFDRIIHNTPEFKNNRDHDMREPIHILTQNILVILFEGKDPISCNPEYVKRIKWMTRIGGFTLDTFSRALIRFFPEKYKNMSTEDMSKLFRTIYNYSERPASKSLSIDTPDGCITITNNTNDKANLVINDPMGPNDSTSL